jgi:SLT domain-containing protein
MAANMQRKNHMAQDWRGSSESRHDIRHIHGQRFRATRYGRIREDKRTEAVTPKRRQWPIGHMHITSDQRHTAQTLHNEYAKHSFIINWSSQGKKANRMDRGVTDSLTDSRNGHGFEPAMRRKWDPESRSCEAIDREMPIQSRKSHPVTPVDR